jgi:hypothetical protein
MNTDDSTKTKFFLVAGKKIARPAFYTLIFAIILAIVVALFIPYGIFIGIYILLIFLLLSYNINCTLVGHCKTWAWILTTAYIIYVTSSVILIFINKQTWINLYTRPKAAVNTTGNSRIKTK